VVCPDRFTAECIPTPSEQLSCACTEGPHIGDATIYDGTCAAGVMEFAMLLCG
jgi:hypothetical protein